MGCYRCGKAGSASPQQPGHCPLLEACPMSNKPENSWVLSTPSYRIVTDAVASTSVLPLCAGEVTYPTLQAETSIRVQTPEGSHGKGWKNQDRELGCGPL